MRNSITSSPFGLVHAADKAAYGAVTNAATIQLHHHGEAKIVADRNGLQAANVSLEQGRATLRQRRAAVQAAINGVVVFLALARDILKPQLGKRHSAAWNITGFTKSLEIPRSVPGLAQVMEMFIQYLTDNPDKEQAPLNITAAAAQALLTALTTASNALIAQQSSVKSLTTARNAAVTVLRKTLIDLKGELGTLIANNDPRWLEFGFNIPAAPQRPDAPTNVIAVLIGPDAVSVKWDAAPRASYYRVWRKVVGIDEAPVPVGNPADLDFILEGLPANATVEIQVSAVNDGGESAPSETVTVALL